MTTEQWEEVKRRFHEALEQAPETQKSFLLRACSDDTVRKEVERLLLENNRSKDFLASPAAASFKSETESLTVYADSSPALPEGAVLKQTRRTRTAHSQFMAAGDTLDRYQIVSLLGVGGMGLVYKAWDPLLRRTVAVKVLQGEFTGDEIALRRFRSEAHALSALNHPNICTLHNIGESEGQTFIVMEYVQGIRLDELIGGGTMQSVEITGLAIQIASGLAKAHMAGIVHRDLKPGNIMVTEDGQVKLLDFGVAKLTSAATPDLVVNSSLLTVEGTIVGTAAYMSPEQAEAKFVDARSDIFSFGAVLYEMIAGKRAFAGGTYIATLSAILHADPEPVSCICPSTPLELERIVSRCLCKNPEGRFQDADSLKVALQKVAGGTDQGVPALGSVRPGKGHRALQIVIATAFCLVIAAAAFLGLRYKSRSPGAPVEKRIAVLPLDVVGNDEAVRALADGLVETLTSKLSQIEEFERMLMIVPASEVRSRHIVSAEAARRIYGANLAITGSAQRWSDRIQFTLNLVDTATVRQIASRTFEFDAANPVRLRDEAVSGMVALLALRLSPASLGSIGTGETSTPAAYAEYLKGMGYLARYDQTGNVDRAIQSLTEATRRDPRYALGFAALGHAHWLRARIKSDAQERELALNNIRESIRIDSNLAEAHVRLGEIYSETGRSAAAIEEERTALRIAPKDFAAHRILGKVYTSLGQYDAAEHAYQEAIKQNPADWLGHLQLGLSYVARGRNADARVQYEAALSLTPDNEMVYRNLAVLDMMEANFQRASETLLKSLQFEKNARTYLSLGAAYYYQRRYAEAAEALKSGIALDSTRYSLWGNLGTVYRHLPGSEQLAKNAFEQAIPLAKKALEVVPSADTHASLAEYWAKVGETENALTEIGRIPLAARAPLADRLALVYQLTGNHRRAVQTIQALPPHDPLLADIRNDPDLGDLCRDPALHQCR